MNKTAILILFALMSVFLFGCQAEKEAVEAEGVLTETIGEENASLLVKGEIAKIELSKVKGIDPVLYKETDKLEIFDGVFSSANKEPGIVNMSDPEFYIKVIMESGEKQYLHLWLGEEGESASLMNIKDTQTIYTVAPDMKGKLDRLINR